MSNLNDGISIVIKKKGEKPIKIRKPVKRKAIKIVGSKSNIPAIFKNVPITQHILSDGEDSEIDVIDKIENLDLDNNLVHIFVYFKDNKSAKENKYAKVGMCTVSILFNLLDLKDKKGLGNDCINLDSSTLYNFYEYNQKIDNILFEAKKEYKKYVLKFVYLKNIPRESDFTLKKSRWRTYFNTVDIDCIYAIDSIFTCKWITNQDFNTHIDNKINLVRDGKVFTIINTKVILKNMKKNKIKIEQPRKRIKKESTTITNSSVKDLFDSAVQQNSDYKECDLLVFVKTSHLFKNPNNLLKTGFLGINILYRDLSKEGGNKKLMFTKDLNSYYEDNMSSGNIQCEFNKKNSKFSMKIVYLKMIDHKIPKPEGWNWGKYSYVLDKNKYASSVAYENKMIEDKIDIMNTDFVVKNRISMNIIMKNILANLKKVT